MPESGKPNNQDVTYAQLDLPDGGSSIRGKKPDPVQYADPATLRSLDDVIPSISEKEVSSFSDSPDARPLRSEMQEMGEQLRNMAQKDREASTIGDVDRTARPSRSEMQEMRQELRDTMPEQQPSPASEELSPLRLRVFDGQLALFDSRPDGSVDIALQPFSSLTQEHVNIFHELQRDGDLVMASADLEEMKQLILLHNPALEVPDNFLQEGRKEHTDLDPNEQAKQEERQARKDKWTMVQKLGQLEDEERGKQGLPTRREERREAFMKSWHSSEEEFFVTDDIGNSSTKNAPPVQDIAATEPNNRSFESDKLEDSSPTLRESSSVLKTRFFDTMKDRFSAMRDAVSSGLGNAWDNVSSAVSAASEAIQNGFKTVWKGIQSSWNSLTYTFDTPLDSTENLLEPKEPLQSSAPEKEKNVSWSQQVTHKIKGFFSRGSDEQVKETNVPSSTLEVENKPQNQVEDTPPISKESGNEMPLRDVLKDGDFRNEVQECVSTLSTQKVRFADQSEITKYYKEEAPSESLLPDATHVDTKTHDGKRGR